MCWERHAMRGVELRGSVDAYDAAGIQPGENVVVVGAFVPFLKSLKQARQQFTVLEMDPATLKPDELPYFRPADQVDAVLSSADVVLITSSPPPTGWGFAGIIPAFVVAIRDLFPSAEASWRIPLVLFTARAEWHSVVGSPGPSSIILASTRQPSALA
jgi:hypothetical protein